MDVEEFHRFLDARLDEDQAQADLWERERAVVAMQADHDPDVYLREPWLRVTTEVLLKRRLLDEHPLTEECVYYGKAKNRPDPFIGCVTCHDWDGLTAPRGICQTRLLVASVYSVHPDYRPEWAPTPEEGA